MDGRTQLGRWRATARSSERLATWIAVATAIVVLVASVALTPPNPSEEFQTAGEADAPLDGTSPSADSPNGQDDPTAGPSASDVDGSVDASGTAGSETGSEPLSGNASDPSAPGAAIERIASDRGVTADEVTVGFMLQNPGGLSSAGFSTGQRTDGAAYIDALAAWASQSGRTDGRTIVAVPRPTDPTSVEDQAAACRAMVDDAKVFAVIDVAAMLDTASQDCLANRTKGDTPFVHSVIWSTDWQARSGGNEISYQAAVDRIARTWARDLGAMRWFPQGAKVGILGDKCPATQPTIVEVLAPALEAHGAGEVVIGNHDCDIESVVSQPLNIATRFRIEGVTHVLTVTNFAATQVFLSAAESQGYRPKYSTSDWFLNTSDATAANFPPDQFDGAIGIASLGSMLKPSGKTPYDGWQLCSQIAVDAGLAPIPPDEASSAELLSLCDNFLLFLDALDLAGPNPTRARWRTAVSQLGQRTSAVFGPSRFAPGKLTGSDQVHTIRWQRDCRCWRSISDFRPAT